MATYYVTSGPLGDDNNNGLSPAAPWSTITKANTAAASSIVLFERGLSFTGKLAPANDAITYDVYGVGVKPIITGSGADFALYIASRRSTSVKNIEFRNDGYSAAQIQSSFQSLYGVIIENCAFKVTGNIAITTAYSVSFTASGFNVYSINFKNNELSNTTGSNVMYFFHGMYKFHTFNILNNNFHDCNGEAIAIIGVSMAVVDTNSSSPYGFDMSDNTFINIRKAAIATHSGLASTPVQSYIRRNKLINIGDINMPNVNAMQLQWCIDVIIEYNYIDGVTTNVPDGDGLEMDWAWVDASHKSNGCILRYNTIKNAKSGNVSSGIQMYAATNCTVHHNICTNNGAGISNTRTHSAGNVFHHNTCTNNKYGGNLDDGGVGSPSPATIWINNLIANNRIYGFRIANGSTSPTETFNLLWNNVINMQVGDINATDQQVSPRIVANIPRSKTVNFGSALGYTVDAAGKIHGSPPAVGAYEYRVNTNKGFSDFKFRF